MKCKNVLNGEQSMKKRNNIYKRYLANIKFLWHSLFRGMASADRIIQAPVGNSDSIEVIQEVGGGSVYKDMLQGKVTQQVAEMRDKYYRVIKEADKYDTSDVKMIINPDNEEDIQFINTTDSLKKKTKADFMKHCEVYNKDNIPIRTIQDNKHLEKHGSIGTFELPKGLYDYETTLTILRDGITPRIKLEKFITKIVVRSKGGDRAYVDLYLPTSPGQFSKIDAILISNLKNMWDTKNFRSDLTDFTGFEWYSYHAWNSPEFCLFKYDDTKLVDIDIFDGNYVLVFDCNIINDGTDMTEKLKTKEVDEQYKMNAPKKDAIDIFTLKRHLDNEEGDRDVDVDNLSTTVFKLDSSD